MCHKWGLTSNAENHKCLYSWQQMFLFHTMLASPSVLNVRDRSSKNNVEQWYRMAIEWWSTTFYAQVVNNIYRFEHASGFWSFSDEICKCFFEQYHFRYYLIFYFVASFNCYLYMHKRSADSLDFVLNATKFIKQV